MTQGSEETYGADYLRECASSWEPGARLLGNMPASAIVAVCDELAEAKATLEGWAAATGYATPEEYAASDEVAQHADAALTSQPEPEQQEDTESLIEQLDEALCTLLHNGDEVGMHAPREHLDLFYARQAARQTETPKEQAEEFSLFWCSQRGLAAAKAKIAELEARITRQRAANSGLQRSYDAATERAAASERDLRVAKAAFALVPPPTPEDSAVLAATDKVPESWLRSCVDASQVTRGLAPLAAAILDLRKARAGRKG